MHAKIRGALHAGVVAAIVAIGSLQPQKAEASGFPTVDIAALIQRILGYVTQLSDYASQLTSEMTQISQLMQLYEDYTQTLREYEHFLNQVRSMRSFISDADWNDLMAAMAPYYGTSDYAVVPTMDPDSGTFDNDVRALLNQYTTVPRTEADFDARLASIDLDSDDFRDTNTQLSAAYSRQMDVYRQVSRNEEDAVERDTRIEGLNNVIENLGDESDLATMQTMATALGMLLMQQQSAIRLQNQQLLNTELPSAQRAARKAGMLDREIDRLEKAMETEHESFTVDVDGF